MTTPTAGVVIPTLNRPERISRCLDALLHGSRHAAQIVVCDQSAGPETRSIVEQRRDEFPGLRYIHLSRPNASAARNAGLHASHADLVAFIDDDCIPGAGWLSALVEEYILSSRAERIAGVTGSVVPLYEAGKGVAVSSRTSIRRQVFRASDGGMQRGEWAPWDIGTGGNILAPRDTLLSIGGFNTRLGPGSRARAAEDIDIMYRLSKQGTLIYQPAAVVYHPASSRQGRLRSRYIYGWGMASMLAGHIGQGDATARRLLLLYLRHQGANALRRGRWGPLESALVLAGASGALLDRRFRPRAPEALMRRGK